ncbi:hypothetical protein DL96DRAFT_1813267 [Flagelloscypha sp. PMI_526]|nr:hypothetical protein DL96DRAFT_1813267 [Flagelloscypha sp. PMI_526]
MEAKAPGYISSHSADVILSDVRPIKLKKDALNALNVLIDEVLFSILNASRSLQTDRLRAGLLTVLNTSLGKEALLEAEVELRAFWERTSSNGESKTTPEDDTKTFNLVWSYELLRLKCEAYSTLNESDEDPEAESRLQNRMITQGAVTSPRQSLVAPAALYLTAILESICEHILSDVARVASRDSSKTGATAQDLFVALCEDDAIYGLFKTMKVYEQIDQLSQGPRPKRSKSISSRTDKLSISRTSTTEQSVTTSSNTSLASMSHPPSAHRPLPSTDTSVASRSSFDKARKKLIGGGSRTSHDRGGSESPQNAAHRRSESVLSSDGAGHVDDDAAFEFDSLMKSGETMKVSLTPDRLRSMEQARKQKENPSSSSPHQQQQQQRSRKPPVVHNPHRCKSRWSSRFSVAHLSPPAARNTPPNTMSKRPSNGALNGGGGSARGMPKSFDADPFPQKTRRVQKKRESMDLDDIMNGSDDEAPQESPAYERHSASLHPEKDWPCRPPGGGAKGHGSGPAHLSRAGRDLVDFLNQGPPDMGPPPAAMSPEAKKGSGRLQRMLSKMSMNGKEDSYNRTPTTPTSQQPHSPARLQKQTSASNLSSLANRPVPPRFPRPISPPSSPTEDQTMQPRQRAISAVAPRAAPPPSSWNEGDVPGGPGKKSIENNVSVTSRNGIAPKNGNNQVASPPLSPERTNGANGVDVTPKRHVSKANGLTAIQTGAPSTRKAPEVIPIQPAPLPAGSFSQDDAKDIRRLFNKATNADECRVLMEMFLAKAGRPVDDAELENPYPSPSPSETQHRTPLAPTQDLHLEAKGLEHSIVDLFLGGEKISEAVLNPTSPRKKRSKRKSTAIKAELTVVACAT